VLASFLELVVGRQVVAIGVFHVFSFSGAAHLAVIYSSIWRKRAVLGPAQVFVWAVLLVVIAPGAARSQDTKITDEPEVIDSTTDWNEVDLGFTTARFGMAFIHEYAAYKQNATGKEQMDLAGVELTDQFKFRDFRFFFNGRLKSTRPLIWKVAAMKDGVTGQWTFRETGLQVGLPEWHSELFIGRSKEGYSLNKVQNGYSTWGNERQMSLDLIPIMNDGIRWYGYLPTSRLFWSIGAFTDGIEEKNRFAIWDYQYSGRFGWRPIFTDGKSELVHIAVNFRYARPDNGEIEVRSKPESNPAPYFLDTGVFTSDRSTAVGGEAYYRKGAFMAGSEVNLYSFRSAEAGNPKYLGGQVVVSYILTGETRPYLSNNSVFFFVEPTRSVFHGGPGAWEVLCLYSSFNLNEGLLPGGRFWKITPTVNWYVSKNRRFEFVYGYGSLDRFNLNGATQFFQTRFQFQIM
jgi:phosphate-selective porin OprO/OprP